MNLRKRPLPASDKEKVADPLLDKHLKLWPEKVKRKRTLKLLSKSLDKNAGSGTLLSSHSLPEEVVEEILSRLPVKSLVRFRCVCKSWHHLTYIERFISLHLKNYRTSQLIVGNCFVLRAICTMYFIPPPLPSPTGGGNSDNDAAASRPSPKMHEKKEFPRLFGGSYNGIVCLYSDRANESILLWNPATNEENWIGNNGYPTPSYSTPISRCTVGFGFDPKTNDYKIFRMVFGEPNPPVARMELYSVRKGSWKNVDSHHDFLVACNVAPTDVICSLPFTDNKIICAVVSPLSGTSKWEILSFDMSTEMYEIISVSPTLDAELGDYERFRYRKRRFKLFPYKETIALGIVHTIGGNERTTYCDIWVLNGSIKSTQSRRSWSKILSTNVTDVYTVPAGCWGSSQVLFQEFSTKRLVSLDLGNDNNNNNMTLVELPVIPPALATIGEYKESLVPIN